MLIIFYGKDSFRSHKHMKEMTAKFKKDRDPQNLNTIILDCEKDKNILEQVLASPFLCEKRMVILKNLLISKNADTQEEIIKYIKEKRIPEENVILFWEGTDSFKTTIAKKLFELLVKEKYSQNFEEFKGVKLGSWILTQTKDRNGKITPEAVQYLMLHSKNDMWKIDSLLDQLCAYCGKEEIKEEDVQLFLDEKADDNIFNLVDVIVGRQEKQAYKMIREQYRKGEDVQFIFSMLLRQFRILLELRDLFERSDKNTSDVLAKKLNLHPFVVKKSLPLVRQYDLMKLKNIYKQLLDLDIAIKTGQGNNQTLLDMFVAKVCI